VQNVETAWVKVPTGTNLQTFWQLGSAGPWYRDHWNEGSARFPQGLHPPQSQDLLPCYHNLPTGQVTVQMFDAAHLESDSPTQQNPSGSS